MLNRGAKIADPDKKREAFLAETCAAPAPPIDWSNLYSTEGLPGSGREVLRRRRAAKARAHWDKFRKHAWTFCNLLAPPRGGRAVSQSPTQIKAFLRLRSNRPQLLFRNETTPYESYHVYVFATPQDSQEELDAACVHLWHHPSGIDKWGYHVGFHTRGMDYKKQMVLCVQRYSMVMDYKKEMVLCVQRYKHDDLPSPSQGSYLTMFWLPIAELADGTLRVNSVNGMATYVYDGVGSCQFALGIGRDLAGFMDVAQATLMAARRQYKKRVCLLSRLRSQLGSIESQEGLYIECLTTRLMAAGLSEDPYCDLHSSGIGRDYARRLHVDALDRCRRVKRQEDAKAARQERHLHAQQEAYDATVSRLSRRTAAAAIANLGVWAEARQAPHVRLAARLCQLNRPAPVESDATRATRVRSQRKQAAADAAERAERRGEAERKRTAERSALLAAAVEAQQTRKAARAERRRARRATRRAMLEKEEQEECERQERRVEDALERRRVREIKAAEKALQRAETSRVEALVRTASRSATRLLRIRRRAVRAAEQAASPPPVPPAPPSPSTQVPSYPSTAVGSVFECGVCMEEDVALGVLVDCKHGFCLSCCRKLAKCPKCGMEVSGAPMAVFF